MAKLHDQSAVLVAAWRSGSKIKAGQIKASNQVIGFLKEAAQATDGLIEGGGGEIYSPDSEQDAAPYLTVERSHLSDPDLEAALRPGTDLDLITNIDLKKRRFICYALVVGNNEPERHIYIKRYNPVQVLSKSLVAVFSDGLTRLEDPILAFDDRFDVVVRATDEDAFALHQNNFEALFKESDAVLEATGDWVDALADLIPIKNSSKEAFVELVKSNSVLRRKLNSVLTRGHLPKLSEKDLKAAMKRHDLDPDVLMPGKKLEVTRENAKQLLYLLNEDLWKGDWSQQPWSASHKRAL